MRPSTIIVPLDGSVLAESAVEPALALASGFDAELLLTRAAWHRPPDREEQYLHDLAVRAGYPKTSCVLLHGFAGPAVSALIEERPSSVLCLATRGHTGLLGQVLLGSVATGVIDAAGAPSVVVGPSCEGERAGKEINGTIIFCFDRSRASCRLQGTIIEWAKALHLDVKVVTVLHRSGEFLGDVPGAAVRRAGEELVDHLSSCGIDAEQVLLDGIDPARAILQLAKETDTALIAAGTTTEESSQGMARLARAVLGSTAERLVRHATVPVLVAQP